MKRMGDICAEAVALEQSDRAAAILLLTRHRHAADFWPWAAIQLARMLREHGRPRSALRLSQRLVSTHTELVGGWGTYIAVESDPDRLTSFSHTCVQILRAAPHIKDKWLRGTLIKILLVDRPADWDLIATKASAHGVLDSADSMRLAEAISVLHRIKIALVGHDKEIQSWCAGILPSDQPCALRGEHCWVNLRLLQAFSVDSLWAEAIKMGVEQTLHPAARVAIDLQDESAGEFVEGARKIFIAGTGRCGTTVLHQILGRHPDVYQVPLESKFIVEGDGLSALIPSLCDRFSVSTSDLALARFANFMMKELPSKDDGASNGPNWHYDKLLGEQHYYPPVERFLAAVTGFQLNGQPFPRHFTGRAELVRLARRLVAEMFGGPMLDAGKIAWIEKTPANLNAVDLLWDLFPEATILHIKRDPRGVLHSFMKQEWAPPDLVHATEFLGTIYWRWQQLKPTINWAGRKYLEIKLEDLAINPEAFVCRIAEMAELEGGGIDLSELRIDEVDNWKSEMPMEHQQYCVQKLRPYFDLMGYEA